ncbi:peptidase T2 asparaginase 2 [Caldithrix abyssi DSM 13497]|uniref:Glycosylasparaginase, Threonine peptidase, MEROPS family T02 n=1 Tax=Caldithrix abyssi DSM 13497 TaxID=880073 RepID=H1XXI3_CALAY|nr:N(4)-(beta-N-acetylglucosaminyl)-L-asparaginase [Caldithrix abyssi]APF19190.1 glycosylasparaginase precursor, Threonine peptidase, MEROPS family T02 [Caldithrix abyssi DSM 13497]EHO43107.1 peptidase T2 asparaginase 2 [Caldithrix abyssi DSM 13497]
MKRRLFLQSTFLTALSGAVLKGKFLRAASFNTNAPRGKVIAVSSKNGLRATQKAAEMMLNGSDALDAVIAGVNIVEEDPEDHSVGYGGLPNEEGVVELDSCVMHGPTHNAGAVASLRNIKNPSKVARLVMERTDHVLLVGEGALKFARAHGFKEEELLTDEARKIWLYWKESLSDKDDWFLPPLEEIPEKYKKLLDITGTITCLGLDLNGNLSGVTTTSGLAFKIPGRVGDSPIIGAGLYVDNEVGACGSTGRGEENLKNLSSYQVVEYMREGYSPEEACKKVLKRVIDHAKLPNLKNKKGLPSFSLKLYAVNKKGEFGAASIYGPTDFAVFDGKENKKYDCAYFYEWKDKKN